LGIGDWGLGPIPNPQSPIPIHLIFVIYHIDILVDNNKFNYIIKLFLSIIYYKPVIYNYNCNYNFNLSNIENQKI
jgi:hypothetical protein